MSWDGRLVGYSDMRNCRLAIVRPRLVSGVDLVIAPLTVLVLCVNGY